ncbi:MAG: hypothetical protein ACYCW6_03785 [Candidatus Xenobia bacterium]
MSDTTTPEEGQPGATPPDDEAPLFDDKPNPVRMAVLSVVLVLTSIAAVWVWMHPSRPSYDHTRIPGIDLTALTADERAEVLQIANDTKCGCGLMNAYGHVCDMNVCECRNLDGTCHHSLRKAYAIEVAVCQKHGHKPPPPPAALTEQPAPATATSGSPVTAASGSPVTAASGSPVTAASGSHKK